MANWLSSLPSVTSIYSDLVALFRDRDSDLAKGLDPTKVTVTNPFTDMICWNSTNSRWERYNGTSWVVLSSNYAINASTASKWATGRTITLTGGDANGVSPAWDGSAPLSFALTLSTVNSNVGTFGSATAVPIITADAKGRITAIGTATLGSIATQAANNVSITGGSISGTSITLPQSPTSAPTAEGRIEWDTDDDKIKVGTGAATKTFTPDDGTATVLNKTFSTGCTWGGNIIPVSNGGTGAGTLTGILKGNGTSPFSVAVSGTDYLAPGAIGTTVQAYDATLAALAGLNTTPGLVEQTGADTFTKRAIGAAGGVQLYDAATAKTNVKQTFTAQQTPMGGTLTDGATINWNGDTNGQVVSLTLGGNRSMNAPTNIVQGAMYLIRITQDATGSRTLSWNSAYKFGNFGAPTLSTTPGKVDFVSFVGGAGNTLECLGVRTGAL